MIWLDSVMVVFLDFCRALLVEQVLIYGLNEVKLETVHVLLKSKPFKKFLAIFLLNDR